MSAPAPLAVTVSKAIAAPADRICDLVSDITSMHRYSTENVAGEWLDGETGPAVGARFKGTNRLGTTTWSTKPVVTAYEPGRLFAFKVPGRSGATWTYRFEPTEDGTLVTESMSQDRPSPFPIRFLQRRAGVTDRGAHLAAAMTTTLERVADAAAELATR